ncbi:MAG: transglutaminase family protein [Phycisphaerales bacterium JB040]
MNTLTALALSLALAAVANTSVAQDDEKLPQRSKFLTYERPQDWQLMSRSILVAGESASNVAYTRGGRTQPTRTLQLDEWEFQEFVAITPFVLRSASSFSTLEPAQGAGTPKPTGKMTLADQPVELTPTIIGPYQSQALYARWDSGPGVTRRMILEQTTRMRSFETVFDERAAMRVPWPGEWPEEALSTLLPQQYISLDGEGNQFDASDTTIPDLLRAWTNDQDPKSIPPVQLAKWLAGKVQEHVNVIRPGMTTRRDLDLELSVASPVKSGLDVQSAPEIARTGKGSPHDLTVLLTALYREAGLPARVVIGYQENEKNGRRELNDDERVRSWVEFALYDEADDELTWVPVDVARLREKSSRMYPLEQPWEFFGTHDELDDVIPYAFHFHPPTDVRSFGAPSMFGITMVPAPPVRGTQYIDFFQTRPPVRAGD